MDVRDRRSLHAARAPPQRTRFGACRGARLASAARRRAGWRRCFRRLAPSSTSGSASPACRSTKSRSPWTRRAVRRRCWYAAVKSAISAPSRRCTPSGRPLRRSRCGAMRRSCTTPCRRSGCWRDSARPGSAAEFFVAEEGASAVAYVVLNVNANGWTLEEAGDRDPAGARLGAMLQVLLAREPVTVCR